MKKYLLIIFLFFCDRCFAQITFIKEYPIGNVSGIGYSIDTTSDNNFILSGQSFYPRPTLMKLNSLGNILWAKHYELSSSGNIKAHQTYDGGYILSGGGINSRFGLAKTDSIGSVLWEKSYQASSYDLFFDLKQTNDSGFILCGTTGTPFVDLDLYIVKTNSIGDTL